MVNDDYQARLTEAFMSEWNKLATICDHTQSLEFGKIIKAMLVVRDDKLEFLRRSEDEQSRQALKFYMAYGDAQAEIRRLEKKLSLADAALARVDALHQPRDVREIRPCERHRGPRVAQLQHVVEECPDCSTGSVKMCINITCCYWPCLDHLELHDESKEACVHQADH